jgi:plastocyanin domain-containing protein
MMSPRFKKPFYRALSAVAALVAVMLLFTVWGDGAPGSGDTDVSEIANGRQVVTSTLSSRGYPNIIVRAGIPVRWVIGAPEGNVNGCNYSIRIPEYGVTHDFRTGENIIEFTPARAGNFRYSCWMGMIRGTITVTERNGNS